MKLKTDCSVVHSPPRPVLCLLPSFAAIVRSFVVSLFFSSFFVFVYRLKAVLHLKASVSVSVSFALFFVVVVFLFPYPFVRSFVRLIFFRLVLCSSALCSLCSVCLSVSDADTKTFHFCCSYRFHVHPFVACAVRSFLLFCCFAPVDFELSIQPEFFASFF